MDDLRNWGFSILMFLVATGSFLYSVFTGRAGEWRKEVASVSARLDEVEMAQARFEEQLRHLPDKETVHRIAMNVAEVHSDTKIQNVTMLSIAESMRRIEKRVFKDD